MYRDTDAPKGLWESGLGGGGLQWGRGDWEVAVERLEGCECAWGQEVVA